MLAIALGDPTGIGPEVALKAVAAELPQDDAIYLLIGDEELALGTNDRLGLELPIERHDSCSPDSRVRLMNPGRSLTPNLPPGAPEAALAAVNALKHGAQLCLRGETSALITAPVNKEAIIRAGEPTFVGQTELLSE